MTGRNLKLGRVVKKPQSNGKLFYFLSVFEINSHFRGMGGGWGESKIC